MSDYRALLLNISNHLTSEDVTGLKYLCVEVIPAGRAEKITRAFEFFSELERLNLLSEENRDFLASKLIAINRNDLRNKLLGIQENETASQISQGQVASAQPNSWDDKPVPGDLVYNLVEDLSTSWKMLGRRLGLTEGVLSNIDSEHRKVVEKGVGMFEEWKKRKTGNASMKALRKALELIGRRDLSERVRDYALKKQQEEIDAAVEHEYQTEIAEQRPFPNLNDMGHVLPNYPPQRVPGEQTEYSSLRPVPSYQPGWTPPNQSFPPFSAPPVTTSGLDPSFIGGWDQPSQVSLPLSTQQAPVGGQDSSIRQQPTLSAQDNETAPTPSAMQAISSHPNLTGFPLQRVAPTYQGGSYANPNLPYYGPLHSGTGQNPPPHSSTSAVPSVTRSQRSQSDSIVVNPSIPHPAQISQPSIDRSVSSPVPLPQSTMVNPTFQPLPPAVPSESASHRPSVTSNVGNEVPQEPTAPPGFSNPPPFNDTSNQRLQTDSSLADPSLGYPVQVSQPSMENPSLQSPLSPDAVTQRPPGSTARQVQEHSASAGSAGLDAIDHPPNGSISTGIPAVADLKVQVSSMGNFLDPAKYEPIEMIGSGGFAKVYLCQCKKTGKKMAVKMCDLGINHEETQKQRRAVENEVTVLSDVKHKYIVQFLYAEEKQNTMLLFLEYMEGGSVEDMLRQKGPLEELLVRKFTWQMLIGVEFLHSKGIIHKDIKGANVLLDGQQQNIKLADFGISKVMTALKTVTGGRVTQGNVASFHWTSPEMLSGQSYGRKTDIWSVGCTVVEMLTTKPPMFNEHLLMQAKMFKIVNHEVEPPKDCTSIAFGFIEKCLRKQEIRPTAAELLKDDPFVQFSPEEMMEVF